MGGFCLFFERERQGRRLVMKTLCGQLRVGDFDTWSRVCRRVSSDKVLGTAGSLTPGQFVTVEASVGTKNRLY